MKPFENASAKLRSDEAKKLTALMSGNRPFSYLRLGDGELNWLLKTAQQQTQYRTRYEYLKDSVPNSVDDAYSVTGLEKKHYTRLLKAFENCTYLDYYDEQNQNNLHRVPFVRSPSKLRNPPEASQIFYEWIHTEFKSYLANRRVLFSGAEAPLMMELFQDSRYRRLAADYFPDDCDVHFAPIRNGGRYYSENLDLIKEDLRRTIKTQKTDTLFLSLASASKIICQELADEEGICAFDFGSLSRALTYSASPGYHAFRSFHNPFLFRVPLAVYLDALDIAHPDMKPEVKIAKAHAQMTFDLQKKTKGSSVSTASGIAKYDYNFKHFYESFAEYKRRFRKTLKSNPEAKILDSNFFFWRLRNGIGFYGIIFQYLVSINKTRKNIIKYFQK
jgi:hypothetical protein